MADLLVETAGASEAQAKACLALAGDLRAGRLVRRRGPRARGRATRCSTRASPSWSGWWRPPAEHSPGLCVADLRIARGLDYYTGTVYETQLRGYERFGSICSGGRYDNLASSGSLSFPGVGISIGVTRLLGLLFGAGALSVSRSVPTCVLVALADEEHRPAGNRIADALRRRGIPTEVSPSRGEVRQADPVRRAARHPVRLVPRRGRAADEVKDIRSGEQVEAAARRRGRRRRRT